MIKITFEFNDVEKATGFMNHTSAYLIPPGDEVPEADEKVDPPKTGRRGRGPAKKKEEEKPAGRRRGRKPAKEETEKKDAPEGADISDAEASKAASEAAKDLTVQVVLDELHEYKVEKVSELDQPQRKGFIARLRDLLNGSDAKNPAFN